MDSILPANSLLHSNSRVPRKRRGSLDEPSIKENRCLNSPCFNRFASPSKNPASPLIVREHHNPYAHGYDRGMNFTVTEQNGDELSTVAEGIVLISPVMDYKKTASLTHSPLKQGEDIHFHPDHDNDIIKGGEWMEVPSIANKKMTTIQSNTLDSWIFPFSKKSAKKKQRMRKERHHSSNKKIMGLSAQACVENYKSSLHLNKKESLFFQEDFEWCHLYGAALICNPLITDTASNLVAMPHKINTLMLCYETIAKVIALNSQAFDNASVEVLCRVACFQNAPNIAKKMQYGLKIIHPKFTLTLERSIHLFQDSHKIPKTKVSDKKKIFYACKTIFDRMKKNSPVFCPDSSFDADRDLDDLCFESLESLEASPFSHKMMITPSDEKKAPTNTKCLFLKDEEHDETKQHALPLFFSTDSSQKEQQSLQEFMSPCDHAFKKMKTS
jgi:hypothetical protein